ncbi:hypothetical protein VTP01DRAFT_10960 [Rhizomucor pusillus]|uniref:uncharacterized protein n=1 Tax=Rhizomucor pusillus TaxID=4840 RepID=UPI003744459C
MIQWRSPQQYQLYAACLYPVTVFTAYFLGDLFLARSYETYFSNKGNIFNVYFVKLGWLWTTFLSLVHFILIEWQFIDRNRRGRRALGRYIVATVYWYIMTQSFLGPSIVDRFFVATGGGCTIAADNGISILQQSACRKLGGQWTGGHDISGHCVLLIHASLYLIEETRWYWDIKIRQSMVNTWRTNVAIGAVLSLLFIWWWMVAMTSVYFHGHRELLSGTFFGIFGWAISRIQEVSDCRDNLRSEGQLWATEEVHATQETAIRPYDVLRTLGQRMLDAHLFTTGERNILSLDHWKDPTIINLFQEAKEIVPKLSEICSASLIEPWHAKAGYEYSSCLKRKYDEMAEGEEENGETISPMAEPPEFALPTDNSQNKKL